jgi:predicted nucleotidyltransferase
MQSTYDKIQYYRIGQKEKETLIAKLKALLDREKQIKLAWLFGSLTRRDSIRDIDLAIYSEQELTFKEFLNLNAQIELEIGLPVDMVEIARVPEVLKQKIFLSGVLIKGTKNLALEIKKKTTKAKADAYSF